jgi:hypothetical protein
MYRSPCGCLFDVSGTWVGQCPSHLGMALQAAELLDYVHRMQHGPECDGCWSVPDDRPVWDR